MLFNDTYRTIKTPAEGSYKEKGSKFLAFAYPLKDADQVKAIIEQLKQAHQKANHHCWALRLTPDESVYKLNDDGEPSGTAGRPILNTLRAAGLTNILIVVVRYFGGTLLGIPGLIRVYKAAASDVINNALVIEKTINDVYELTFEQPLMNLVMRIIKEEELKIIMQNYQDMNILTVSIRKNAVNRVVGLLNNLQNIQLKYLYSE